MGSAASSKMILNLSDKPYSGMVEFETANDLEKYVNTLPAGTYKIVYIINYLDTETVTFRTVTLR